MNRGIIWNGMLVFLSLSLLVSAFAGCTGGAPEGREIRIGVTAGLTGQVSGTIVPIAEEIEHTLRYINEVEGGIEGVKLNWRVVDNKGAPDGAIIAYKELRDTFDPLIYVSIEDYIFAGIQDMIAEDKAVILTYAANNPQLYVPPGRFFSMGIPSPDGFAGFIRWVSDNWQGSEAPKVGVLHWERESGLQWKMAESWVAKQGVELVPVSYSITTMDLKPQLLILRDAGVDYIWCLGVAQNAAVAIRDFRSLGLMGEIPFFFMEYMEGNVLLDLVGSEAEGFYDYRAESPYSEGSQAAKLYSEIWQWAAEEDKWSDNRLNITLKATLSAVIKQAVADVGWDNLDGEAIYNALNKLKNIDTWGNLKDYGFGPDKRIGVSTVKMKVYTKDETVAASDWIELPRVFEGVDS